MIRPFQIPFEKSIFIKAFSCIMRKTRIKGVAATASLDSEAAVQFTLRFFKTILRARHPRVVDRRFILGDEEREHFVVFMRKPEVQPLPFSRRGTRPGRSPGHGSRSSSAAVGLRLQAIQRRCGARRTDKMAAAPGGRPPKRFGECRKHQAPTLLIFRLRFFYRLLGLILRRRRSTVSRSMTGVDSVCFRKKRPRRVRRNRNGDLLPRTWKPRWSAMGREC